MVGGFPKTVRLKDGTIATLRLMVSDDFVQLLKFFRALPEEDRHFLRFDVTDREMVARRCQELDYNRTLPVLAEIHDEIVGHAALEMKTYGWERDLGRVRCVIARPWQRKGLGTIMIGELFGCAVELGLDKLQARVMDSQAAAFRACEKVGFVQEAVLKRHVTDIAGEKHDLIIMTNSVEALWRKMEDTVAGSEMTMEH
jgi:RimJ/RimL family protein N-acetyltransferase